MIGFKEWLKLEINKGLARDFAQQYGHLPSYVQKQVLHNRIAPLWKNSASSTPTGHIYTGAEGTASKQLGEKPVNLKDIYHDRRVSSIANYKNWSKQVLELHPNDFTDATIDRFLGHQFGSSPAIEKSVRNHRERMIQQNQLAQERGEQNEPIVLVRVGNKFEMQEGWHRLYTYFMRYSAPPEERDKILRGDTNLIDFSKWKPVKMTAWIGDNIVNGENGTSQGNFNLAPTIALSN